MTFEGYPKEYLNRLIYVAFLDLVQFADGRLKDTNQESYELISYDDSVLTLLDLAGYKVHTAPSESESDVWLSTLSLNGKEVGIFISEHKAQHEALSKILQEILGL